MIFIFSLLEKMAKNFSASMFSPDGLRDKQKDESLRDK